MLLPLALIVLLGVDWASGYAIAGYVMQHGVTPYGYAFWQSVGPFICLFIIQIFRKEAFINDGSLIYSILCGIFGIVIPNLLIYLASRYVTSGVLTVLANIAPIFTYPLALVYKQEKWNYLRMLLVVVGTVGTIIIVTVNQQHLLDNSMSNWLYLALLIPFCYAWTAVFIPRFKPKSGNILSYATNMLLVASICITPLTIHNHQFYSLNLFELNSNLILLEIVLSTIGYVLLFIILNLTGPVYYTLVNAIAVLSGVFYGKIIFKQQFSNLTYLAIILILTAICGLTKTTKIMKVSKNEF